MSPQEAAVVACAQLVASWYDRNDEAKANRRDFPATEELRLLLASMRGAVKKLEKVNA